MSRHITTLLLALLLLSGCSSVSDNRPDSVRKSEYYLEHGVDAYANSDYVTATDFFLKALAHYRSIDDTQGTLLALINLAETAMMTGNAEAVLRYLDEAQTVSRRMQPPRYLSRLQLMRAQLYWREHDRQRVLSLLEPLLPAFDGKNEPLSRPSRLDLTALILRTDIAFDEYDTDPAEARRWLLRLENALRQNSDSTPMHDARLSRFHAQLAYHDNKPEQALKLLEDALAHYRQAAVRPAIAATLSEMARIHMKMGDWEPAQAKLQRALYVRLWILDRIGSHETLKLLHEVYLGLGDGERAAEALRQAEQIISNTTAVETLRREQLSR